MIISILILCVLLMCSIQKIYILELQLDYAIEREKITKIESAEATASPHYTAEQLDEIYKDNPQLGKLAKVLWGVDDEYEMVLRKKECPFGLSKEECKKAPPHYIDSDTVGDMIPESFFENVSKAIKGAN